MINRGIKMPSKVDLMRAAMAEMEKQITRTAKRAATPQGRVKFRFDRKPDRSIRSVAFEGSGAAIAAAKAAASN